MIDNKALGNSCFTNRCSIKTDVLHRSKVTDANAVRDIGDISQTPGPCGNVASHIRTGTVLRWVDFCTYLRSSEVLPYYFEGCFG